MTSVTTDAERRPSLVRPDVLSGRSWHLVTAMVCVGLPFVLGAGLPFVNALTVGSALSLALAPVWLPHVGRFRGARVLGALVAACLAWAPLLAMWTAADHRLSNRGLVSELLTLVGVAASVGALLWARRVIPVAWIAVSYALGLVIGVILHPGIAYAENPWRFGYAVPVTILVLALSSLSGRLWLELGSIATLAIVSAAEGGRSSSGLLTMAGALVLWQHRPRLTGRAASALGTIAVVLVLGWGVYNSLQGAALEGYLGQAAQQRTQAQLDLSGSLIRGGRPESGASTALFESRPQGFGPGIAPSMDDLLTAKQGMVAIGYDPDNGYVERYMFGQGRIELHSVGADLWVLYGLPGLALVLGLVWAALHYLGRGLADRTAIALGVFLALRTLWDLAFSPIGSSLDQLVLAVAVILVPARRRPGRRPSAGTRRTPRPTRL